MKPVIGLTCSFQDSVGWYFIKSDYVDAVVNAGGIPVILPNQSTPGYCEQYAHMCDGFLFSGGGDVDPAYWGEEPQPGISDVDPARDRFELELTNVILALDKPCLFICRGIQVLNVAFGGDLIQNLASNIAHRQKAPRRYPFHDVLIDRDTLLYRIFKHDLIRVNSFHHQAICRPGKDLRITARSRDNVIEAVEHPGKRFVLGVQWHPENMKDQYSRALFAALIAAAVPA